MKKLLALSLLLGIFSAPSVLGVSGTFKIKNEGPRSVYYSIVVGDIIPAGDLDQAKRLNSGETQTTPLSALQLPTYVGIWQTEPGDLRLIDVQGGVNFRPQAFKIYTFKPGKSIDVNWTGDKLRPKSMFGTIGARASKKLLGTVKSVTLIPSR